MHFTLEVYSTILLLNLFFSFEWEDIAKILTYFIWLFLLLYQEIFLLQSQKKSPKKAPKVVEEEPVESSEEEQVEKVSFSKIIYYVHGTYVQYRVCTVL